MNYLQLCQRMALECGVSGTLVTTAGQQGSLQRIVTWVNQAWNDLQLEHDDWGFMRSSVLLGSSGAGGSGAGASFATVAGQASYPLGTGSGTSGVAAASFGKWDADSFRVYSTAQGTQNEWFLDHIRFEEWRNGYMLGAMRSVQTRPVAVAIGPNNEVCLGPPPDGTYTVEGDYFTSPSVLSADTDTPGALPYQYQMAIIYKAMEYYGFYEAASEVIERGQMEYKRILAQLEAIYGPRIHIAGTLF